MIVNFTAQMMPYLWALAVLLLALAAVLFACVDPELAEVYLGDLQLLVAAIAVAAIAVAVLVGGRADAARDLGLCLPPG